MNWNNILFQKIHSFAGRSSFLDAVGVFLAEYLTYLLIIGIVVWIFSRPTKKAVFSAFSLISLSVLFSRGIITEAISFFYKSPRPFMVLGFEPLIFNGNQSFPSGHTALLFAFAFSIFYINKKLGIWLGVAGLLVGLARIYVGVHWPIDILGGIAVALVGTYVAYLAFKKAIGDKAVIKENNNGVI